MPSSRPPRIVLRDGPASDGGVGGRTLSGYIRELVSALGAGEPGAVERMRRIVGRRRARIRLDEETAEVQFDGGELVVTDGDTGRDVDGEGETDTETVHRLLAGEAGLNDAILDGRLRVRGPVEDVTRMFAAVALLLDGATRVPELRDLADEFRRTGRRPSGREPPGAGRSARPPFADPVPPRRQLGLLDDLDLLP